MVFRVFVEKKPALANESHALLRELSTLPGVQGVSSLRIINRYDVDNIDADLFAYAKSTVFSEPQIDIVTDTPALAEDERMFAVEYLPGQFDQRADSAAQCIQLISQKERPIVRTARVYVLGGNPYAARLAGLNPKAVIYKLHILSGIMAALAGALLAARMNSGQPSACDGLEFDGVTAAVLGGCAFTGGVGTILGTFIGMLVLQSFNTGLIMLNVQIFWQNVAQGALLVVALAFDFYRKKAAAKKLETKTA